MIFSTGECCRPLGEKTIQSRRQNPQPSAFGTCGQLGIQNNPIAAIFMAFPATYMYLSMAPNPLVRFGDLLRSSVFKLQLSLGPVS